jgi:hypothetical protein
VPAILLAIGIFVIVLLVILPRINELFLISVRGGRALVIRGRVPAALLRDLNDVIENASVEQASIRAVRTTSHARLVVRGVDEAVEQRLRNTFGVHPASKLRAAQAPASDRNFGQLLGWTWLAWLLHSRSR